MTYRSQRGASDEERRMDTRDEGETRPTTGGATQQLSDPLALESQICFALAVASRGVIGAYRSVLEPIHLTHPQYLVMLALWQHEKLTVRQIAQLLRLEPATVAPLVDRKSTRLNSSHVAISYAVFCLKKKRGQDRP